MPSDLASAARPGVATALVASARAPLPGAVAVLGEESLVEGYRLAGALVLVAESPAEVTRVWAQVPGAVAVVLLSPRAAQALGERVHDPGAPMSVVLP